MNIIWKSSVKSAKYMLYKIYQKWACVLFLCWKKWNELSKEMIIHSNLYWKVVLQRPLTFDTFENCYQRNLLTNKILSKTLEIEFDKLQEMDIDLTLIVKGPRSLRETQRSGGQTDSCNYIVEVLI